MVVGVALSMMVVSATAEEPTLGISDQYILGQTEKNGEMKDTLTFIGTIKKSVFEAENVYDSVTMTLVFTGDNLAQPKTITHEFTRVFSTVANVASTDEATAAAQSGVFVDDENIYLYALTIVGITPGRYSVSASVVPNDAGAAIAEEEATAEFDLTVFITDGRTDDWTAEQKANALKGWHEDDQGRTRGMEYMAFIDANYVYLYVKAITASNAAKTIQPWFNKNRTVMNTINDNNIMRSYISENNELENGLYETVGEYVIKKSPYVNSLGTVFLGVRILGCDAGFDPLSWYSDGTIWTLNHRTPLNANMSHQKVTETGFAHYHDLDENNVCGWCGETVNLPITVDGDASDWDAEVMAAAKSSSNANYNLSNVAAFYDEQHLYLYAEITHLSNKVGNYINIIIPSSVGQTCGIHHNAQNWELCYDENGLRPYCINSQENCNYPNHEDCDDGFVKYAMQQTTNEAGQTVVKLELVLDVNVVSQSNGKIRLAFQINDIATWGGALTYNPWGDLKPAS